MSNVIEVKVPDIGDFADVEVIEVLVNVGDTINAEDSLISVESDKAAMEIPAPQGGVVKELLVGLGDKVSKGSSILMLEVGAEAQAPVQVKPTVHETAGEREQAPAVSEAPKAASFSGNVDKSAQTVVLGSGPGGYTAAFRAADLGQNVILIERYD